MNEIIGFVGLRAFGPYSGRVLRVEQNAFFLGVPFGLVGPEALNLNGFRV